MPQCRGSIILHYSYSTENIKMLITERLYLYPEPTQSRLVSPPSAKIDFLTRVWFLNYVKSIRPRFEIPTVFVVLVWMKISRTNDCRREFTSFYSEVYYFTPTINRLISLFGVCLYFRFFVNDKKWWKKCFIEFSV